MTKPLDLPRDVALEFVEDARKFLAEENQIKADEIAARQLHVLWAYQRPHEEKLRLSDVKEMFLQMRDYI